MPPHAVENHAREFLRCGRVLRMILEDLRLDIEFEFSSRRKRKHLVESRYSRAGNRNLFRKLGVSLRAAVPLPQFVQCERADRPWRAGSFAYFRIEQRI